MKSEDLAHLQIEFSIDEVVACLNELEPYCPSKEEYSGLCLLLTLPRLSDHATYKDWSPSSARVQCFKDIYPLVSMFLPIDKNLNEMEHTANKDRLVQLLLKGVMFEACVDYCQQQATAKDIHDSKLAMRGMLTGTDADDSDLSLLSWLQSIPLGTFNCPFEQKSLDLNVKKIIKPSTSWSEQIMTPMTPTPSSKQRMSPSPGTPNLYRGRPWSSGARGLSQSLNPTLEAVLMNPGKKKEDNPVNDQSLLSRSFANFHLPPGMSPNSSLPTLSEDAAGERTSPQQQVQSMVPILRDPRELHQSFREHQVPSQEQHQSPRQQAQPSPRQQVQSPRQQAQTPPQV